MYHYELIDQRQFHTLIGLLKCVPLLGSVQNFFLSSMHLLLISEPVLIGSCTATSELSIFCNTTLDQTQVPLEYTCSYDSGPEEPCMSD